LAHDVSLFSPGSDLARPAPVRRALPAPLESAGAAFVGRDTDLARLEERWAAATAGEGQFVSILGPEGIAGFIGDATGNPSFRILGTPFAILLGVVYGYLPLMIFPIYVTMERMDRTLMEASKDLGAGRWATFRQITLPITLPGLITGSILVFIPLMGEYVVPAILGYSRVFLIGNQLVLQFLEARDWPQGAAKAVVLILIMLVSIVFYIWFSNRGRKVREVSVL